jgi:hypothetical protein
MSLSRTDLLQKEELERVKVDLGKGEFVFVRAMTGRERDKWEQSLIKERKDNKGNVISYDRSLDDFRAKLAICTVCDEKGDAIFLPDDAPTLSKNMSAKRLESIVNAAQKLNAISEEDKDALIKNSEPESAGDSNSGSVEN